MSTGLNASVFRCEPLAALDNRALTYVNAADACFSDLKRVVAQLAGLLLLQASGARSGGPDHPMVATVEDLHAKTLDAISALAPKSSVARHHHLHLCAAAERLTEVLVLVRGGRLDRLAVTAPTRLLTQAWDELGHASRALPGFELVDLSQACCARHRSPGQPQQN